ncbi:protein translocase subunit SecF [Sphingomonas sp. CGMCC 1.13654]|uniref:Protein-export membrane protein SecF n=1 Tax=Sphingomonas chungangi TaxID=2683589 RepID=A0A838L7L7_9SPHN|nr:protein translocase subunit SecF [Sphingomonas chungangi]MBA2934910.1 protein translocase subunit SecF [Sphingomonas chungangi]MVW58221.1 protein translocase subunit SecF [Sphingomonas chungangi]
MRLLKIVPDNTNIGFVRLRGWAFGLTALLTVAAAVLVGVRGLNFGVDFVGGVSIEAKFDGTAPLGGMRGIIDGLGVGEGQLQPFGDGSSVDIRLPLPTSTDEGASNAMVAKVEAALKVKYPSVRFNQVQTVSGKVSDELIWKGTLAVVLAITGIALFGIFRFEWQFGVATFISIFHDVLMTLGFFALTRMEFDLNIVAAVLTIIGYSINDKIVIDDRIRENLRKYRQMPLGELIDLSVNETLPRTVMTSLTILLALASLLLFGGHVLRGFTAAMMLGVVVGTYSSIYVSSSLLITLGLDKSRFRQMAEATDKKKAARARAERIGPKD